VSKASAFAKLNLALVVGALREDATHDVATVLIRIDLHDDIALEPSDALAVEGFPDDTLVRGALEHLAETAGVEPSWHVRITKRIPVAAGLGGGSSDAAAALELANATLEGPLPLGDLHDVARRIGADVPFFLRPGPQLATGDGTELEDVILPIDFSVLLVAPDGQVKNSTREVYDAFDARAGSSPFSHPMTWRRLRSPRSSRSLVRSALTSPGPGRPSMASSRIGSLRRRRDEGSRGRGGPRSPVPSSSEGVSSAGGWRRPRRRQPLADRKHVAPRRAGTPRTSSARPRASWRTPP
jgi:GHMP kinase-like protein